MARSSIGLFGVFGRSEDLRSLDEAFRALDVHPRMVPEAVKLTMSRLLKDHCGSEPSPRAYQQAAELVAYCMIGPESFAGANSVALALAVEARVERALVVGASLDAQLILLAIHAGVIQPAVVDKFELEAGD